MSAQIDWSLIGQATVHSVPNGHLIKKLQDQSLEPLEIMSRCYRRILEVTLIPETGGLVAGVQVSVLDLRITILTDTGTKTTPIDVMGLQLVRGCQGIIIHRQTQVEEIGTLVRTEAEDTLWDLHHFLLTLKSICRKRDVSLHLH